jgi:hypothetical protein
MRVRDGVFRQLIDRVRKAAQSARPASYVRSAAGLRAYLVT